MNDSTKPSTEEKKPHFRRHKLYERMNINETYLDYFIIGVIVLLLLVIFIGVL